MTDIEIIEKVKAGHLRLFAEIVSRYQAHIAAIVYGMLGQCPQAEDVGQEVFIRFYQNLEAFRGDASVKTYLTRIAVNLSINSSEKRNRRRKTFTNEINDTEALGKEMVLQEDIQLIYRAITKLDARFKSVIVLRLVEGYSTQETSEILQIPTGTVLSRLARGQKKLKEMLMPVFGSAYET